MKVGDLVICPTTRKDWVAGVVEDLASREKENQVGVRWPDSREKLDYIPKMWLQVIDFTESGEDHSSEDRRTR